MTPSVRKLALTAHVTASVGWVGALAVFLAHAIAGLASRDEQVVRATSIAMGLTTWFVILPLCLTTVATGVLQALGTAWGLFRHYWILFKLLLTAVATIVLLLKVGPIGHLADAAAQATFSSGDLIGLRTSIMVHAGAGLLVLMAAVVLAVYKPQGITPYGMRGQREHGGPGIWPGPGAARDTPDWVKWFGACVVALILAVGAMLIVGGHGG